MPIWETYPFRQDILTVSTAYSRSFSFRPGLRLGIVYNRLNAQAVFEKIKNHPHFNRLSAFVLQSLMQCDWPVEKFPKTRTSVDLYLKNLLESHPQWITKSSLQLNYHQLWRLFNLSIQDVDIRFSYNHEGYSNLDARQKIMSPGYIGRYHNSYFDGSATIDELLSAKIANEITKEIPQFLNQVRFRGLTEKYQKFETRYAYDKNIFKTYDDLGQWIAIPYPELIFNTHHREIYTEQMKAQHRLVCYRSIELIKQQYLKGNFQIKQSMIEF